MKRLVLLLLVCAACKSSSDAKPAPAAAADDTPQQQAALPRTRQSNRVAPALPDDGVEGSNRPSLPEDRPRHHRGDWGGSNMTDEQREAMMKQRAESVRSRMDANGDGKLSYDELKNAQGRMHFDNPEEIDTNHDGDISADELEAAMKARRDAFRAQRQAQQGSAAAAPPADPNAP
jgi:hypothetical protein